MSEINKNPLDIGYIVHKVRTSEAFAHAQNDPEANDTSEADRARRSVRLAANVLKDAKPSGHLSLEGHVFNVTAELTTFGDSLRELHELKKEGAYHTEKLQSLQRITAFNHAVKGLIESNSSISYTEVLSFILTMNRSINGVQAGGHQFEHEVRDTLVGIRHEIAVEQMLGYMDNVEYREATIDEDIQGADIFVSLDGGPMTPLDIKASNETAHIKREQAQSRGFDGSHIIWSHINDEDFNGTFRISHELAAERSAELYRDIKRASQHHAQTTKQRAS